MSRSYKKKNIIKDKSRFAQKSGNRSMRRKIKQKAKKADEDTMFPEDKSEVINDYDVSDFKILDADKYVGKGKRKRVTK